VAYSANPQRFSIRSSAKISAARQWSAFQRQIISGFSVENQYNFQKHHAAQPVAERHLEHLLAEYVQYYNNVRTHQTLGGETPVKRTQHPQTVVSDTVLKANPILSGLYHDYQKVA